MSGRFDERMVTIAWQGGDETLEGVYLRGEGEDGRGAVIAPPHPLYGGSLESPVLNELAFACQRAGIASLRFNWRGVGASAGIPSGEAGDADADYGAALLHLRETVPGPYLACGYSFGAATAARVAATSKAVDRLILVAPPPSLLEPAFLEGLRGRVLVIGGSEDAIAPVAGYVEVLSERSGSRVDVIPGADHFFGVGLARVGSLAADWLGVERGD
ncbi:MAG: alpha/beta hydrolase [Myxococcota bacterium]|nr:alpha/beta hydrolase [Myxococcota bacterium]